MDEDAPQLPFGTIFQPNTWLDQPEGDQELGEVPGAARAYATGQAPYPMAGDGHYCGTEADFAGLGTAPAAPPELNGFGGLACCPLPDPPYVYFACPATPAGTWSDFDCTPAGGDPLSGWANLLGHHRLRVEDPCEWNGPTVHAFGGVPCRWNMFAIPAGDRARMFVEVSGGVHPVWAGHLESPPWDGLSTMRFLLDTAIPPAGAPTSLLVVPGLPPSDWFRDCDIIGHRIITSVVVRFPAPQSGLTWGTQTGDFPLSATAECQWSGRMWYRGVRFPGLPRLWAFREFHLVWTPGPRLALLLITPDLQEIEYLADAGDWDQITPIALVRQNSSVLVGTPTAVTVFNPDGPAPP